MLLMNEDDGVKHNIAEMNMIRRILSQVSKYQLVGVLIIYLFLAHTMILDSPPVWPDEAYIADVSLNLLQENRLGTSLWGEMVPGVEDHLYFYPPGIFLLNAGLFKLTGLSIYAQRMLALTTGAGFLVGFYFLGKKVTGLKNAKSKEIIFVYLAALLLTIDHVFLKAVRWGRPEIFVLLLSCLALIVLFMAEESKAKMRNYLFSFAGLLLGIALLFHLFSVIYIMAAVVYWIYKYRLKIFQLSQSYYFFLPIILVLGLWLTVISPNINYFFTQVGLQKMYREVSPSYLLIIANTSPIHIKIYSLIMFLVLVIGLGYSLIKKNARLLLISLIVLFSWFYAYIGKIEAYPALFVPLSYLILTVLLKSRPGRGRRFSKFNLKLFCGASVAVLCIINLYIYQENIRAFLWSYRSYQVFSENLRGKIPQDSNIYLSSIPDAYYIVRQNTNSKVYTFPALATSKNEYLKVLNKTDYVIYNFNPESMFFGNYFNEYLTLNAQEVTPIGLEDEYRVLLIKLVGRELRKEP